MEAWKKRALEAATTLRDKAVELHEETIKPTALSMYNQTATAVNAYYDEEGEGSGGEHPISTQPLPSNTVFGKALSAAPLDATTKTPVVVSLCVARVAADANDYVGVYRLSGAHSQVDRIKRLFTTSSSPTNSDFDCDIDTAASVLKSYFRELKEPMIPLSDSAAFDAYCDPEGNTDSTTLSTLAGYLISLPIVTYNTLKLLLAHLDEIQLHANINKMSLGNLSIVFSPTLQIPANLFCCLVKNRKYLFSVRVPQGTSPQQSEPGPAKPQRKTAPPPPPPSKRTGSNSGTPATTATPNITSTSPPLVSPRPLSTPSGIQFTDPPIPRSRTPIQQVPPRPGSTGIVANAINRFSTPELSSSSSQVVEGISKIQLGGNTVVNGAATGASGSIGRRPAPPPPPSRK
ncbi:UNVERIFIED_CONTAM: RalA-binding protein 1 [Siphonaria sp. JEL0065]|nr:RalA-binding protein 1 [Siphonaria sp. JEL0065]